MKIKDIIWEELKSFLNEMLGDDEIANKTNIDLYEEYNRTNKELFNNQLPEVPMKWDNTRRRLGVVKSQRNAITGEARVISLGISVFYNSSYKQFKDTLAHEMIHVKQILVTKEGGNHGISFHREADRINRMGLGYNIDVRESGERELSSSVRGKSLIGIIIEADGEFFLNVTTRKVFDAEFETQLVTYYQRQVNKGSNKNVEITVVESTNPELLKARQTRTYRRGFSYMRLKNELLEDLLDDNIIRTVKFTPNQPAMVAEEQENSGEWVTSIIS